MLNIGVIQSILGVIGIVILSIALGRWIGKRQRTGTVPAAGQHRSGDTVKFFASARDRDTTLFMLLCFATVWMLARWFQKHIDVATVSLVLGSLITVIITMGAALYPEGNKADSDTQNGGASTHDSDDRRSTLVGNPHGNDETPPSPDH